MHHSNFELLKDMMSSPLFKKDASFARIATDLARMTRTAQMSLRDAMLSKRLRQTLAANILAAAVGNSQRKGYVDPGGVRDFLMNPSAKAKGLRSPWGPVDFGIFQMMMSLACVGKATATHPELQDAADAIEPACRQYAVGLDLAEKSPGGGTVVWGKMSATGLDKTGFTESVAKDLAEMKNEAARIASSGGGKSPATPPAAGTSGGTAPGAAPAAVPGGATPASGGKSIPPPDARTQQEWRSGAADADAGFKASFKASVTDMSPLMPDFMKSMDMIYPMIVKPGVPVDYNQMHEVARNLAVIMLVAFNKLTDEEAPMRAAYQASVFIDSVVNNPQWRQIPWIVNGIPQVAKSGIANRGTQIDPQTAGLVHDELRGNVEKKIAVALRQASASASGRSKAAIDNMLTNLPGMIDNYEKWSDTVRVQSPSDSMTWDIIKNRMRRNKEKDPKKLAEYIENEIATMDPSQTPGATKPSGAELWGSKITIGACIFILSELKKIAAGVGDDEQQYGWSY